LNWAAFNLRNFQEFVVGRLEPIKVVDAESGQGDCDSETPSRRRVERQELSTGAAVRNVFGVKTTGRVIDVSQHGCQIELRSGYLREGQFVSIRIGGLEPWVGIVRWGDLKSYGIEFSHPLYAPIVDHLALNHPMVMID
jgi:hypothetical protein